MIEFIKEFGITFLCFFIGYSWVFDCPGIEIEEVE